MVQVVIALKNDNVILMCAIENDEIIVAYSIPKPILMTEVEYVRVNVYDKELALEALGLDAERNDMVQVKPESIHSVNLIQHKDG